MQERATWALAHVLALLIIVSPGVVSAQPTSPAPTTYRWVWTMKNLLTDSNVPVVQSILRTAKTDGYNGVVISDYKLQILDELSPEEYRTYAAHIATLRQTAQALGIDLYPCVAPVGYSNGLLSHDPNLAEGLPVVNMPFVAHNGTAAPTADASANILKDGDFERADGDKMLDWTFQDNVGTASFVDRQVKHSGAQSLRMTNIGTADPQYGHGRIMQTVTVVPFREYRLTVWIKTQDFENPSSVQAKVLTSDGDSLDYDQWTIQKTQDWTEYVGVFNSLDNTSLNIYFGTWGGKGGTIWFDDVDLRQVGLLNVLRRAGCPLTVVSEDGTVYKEGRDFKPVVDPHLGNIPYAGEYDIVHAPPLIELTATSRIRDGEQLKVSYYHPVIIGTDSVACCLSDPEVYSLIDNEIKETNTLFHPKGFFLGYDELRVVNWDEACTSRHLSPGQLLAASVHRVVAMVHKASPTAQVFVWSDMFDPYQNAHDDYYLANGTLAGSWKGLASNVIIVNWNQDHAEQSLPWFEKMGNAQILAGYYDNSAQSIASWMEAAKGISGVMGEMYTTWSDNYSDLGAFAQSAWGEPSKNESN